MGAVHISGRGAIIEGPSLVSGLCLHPDCASSVTSLQVALLRPSAGILQMRWRAAVEPNAMVLPSDSSAPRRRDGLWRHTCFEAFVRPEGGEAYLELNFSPSGDWAAYGFDGYRRGMAEAQLAAPRIETRLGDRAIELSAEVEGLPPGPWQMGLSAVVEEADGPLSYWALAHPPGRPDFHHPDCFALHLPPPERP